MKIFLNCLFFQAVSMKTHFYLLHSSFNNPKIFFFQMNLETKLGDISPEMMTKGNGSTNNKYDK